MSSWRHLSPFSGFPMRLGPAGGATPPADDAWGSEWPGAADDVDMAPAAEPTPGRSYGVDEHGDGAAVHDGREDDGDVAAAPAFEEFDDRQERIPFFKRELRFGRRKHRDDEVADEEEELPQAGDEGGVAEAVEVEPEPVPLFTRELSFRSPHARSGEETGEVAAAGEEVHEPTADPWAEEWDEEEAAVAEADADASGEHELDAPGAGLAFAGEPEAAAERIPFYRRPITFRRRQGFEVDDEMDRREPHEPHEALERLEHAAGAELSLPDDDAGWSDEAIGWDEDVPGWGDAPSEQPLALGADRAWHEDEPELPAASDLDGGWEPEVVVEAEGDEAESRPEPDSDDPVPSELEWAVSSRDADGSADEPVSDELEWAAPREAPDLEPVSDELEWAGSSDASGPEPDGTVADEHRVRETDMPETDVPGPGEVNPWADDAGSVEERVSTESGWEEAAGEPEEMGGEPEQDAAAVAAWEAGGVTEASPWAEPVVAASSLSDEEELAAAGAESPTAEGTEDTSAAGGAAGRFGRRRRGKRGRTDAEPRPSGHGARGGKNRGRVVGLKIGASQLAAAVVLDREGMTELVQIARSPLEPGIVVDGEIRDEESLANALRRFFAEHDLPTRDIHVGLASNRIGVRTFDIVGVEDEEQFDNAVRFKAHEVLPIAVQESVLDYRVISERTTEAGEALRRVLLVVAPREQVRPYLDVCRGAGLRVAGIDLEALGLLRAFVDPMPLALRSSEDNAVVIVSIGHEATTLLVAGGGVCEFTRVFDWGGGSLQEAIANELQLPMAEAATVLRHVSLAGPPSRPLASITDDQRRVAVEAVRLRLMPFARELVSSLQFYQTQPDSLGIGEIVITGGTSQLEGLAEALNQMIGVAVRVGDPFSRVEVSGDVDPHLLAAPGGLAVPVGLAIEDDRSRAVDLVPAESRQQPRRRPGARALALPVAALVPIAALGLLFVQANGKVGDKEGQLSALRQQLATLPRPKGVQIDPALQGEQAQRATAVADVLGRRLAWDRVLGDLSRVVPENVWLTQLTAEAASPLTSGEAETASAPASPAAEPTGVTISGFTYAHADVARLLSRLATVPSLANVQLGSSATAVVGSTDGGTGGKTVVQFTIVADMNQAGGTT